MKIMHLISGGDVGGAKTHVLSLLCGLGKTQTVRLVCFTDGPFADDARKLGIDTLVMDCGVPESVRRLSRMISAGDQMHDFHKNSPVLRSYACFLALHRIK